MLDLSRPLDPIEGVTLYGDHEDPRIVYYLPDDIRLRTVDDRPELSLQIYTTDEAVVGEGSLEESVGSILSLGATCTLDPDREQQVRDELGRRGSGLGFTIADDFVLTPPPWQSGAVDFVLLDAMASELRDDARDARDARDDDRMVTRVVGSKRPSLSDGQLSALFHARLDRRGTALVRAALDSGRAALDRDQAALAAVLYDLRFAALRPSAELRMSADLKRMGEYFQAGLSAQIYWFRADVMAAFDHLRDDGVIDVDLINYGDSAEERKLVDEAVRDFYETLMKELFRPTVNPATLTATPPIGGGTGAGRVGVGLSFRAGVSHHERTITVDYRSRSATERTHNPQAHIAGLAAQAGGSERVVQWVPVSQAWREMHVEVAAPAAFDDPLLREIAVVLWPGDQPVLDPDQAREGGLRMPESVAPLSYFAFSRDDAAPRDLRWTLASEQSPSYWWQARLRYRPADHIDAPTEMWTPPRRSSTRDLNLFPDLLAPLRRVRVQLAPVTVPGLAHVRVDLVARDRHGHELAQRTVHITADSEPADSEPAQFALRRLADTDVRFEAGLVYHLDRGRAVTRGPVLLTDAHWLVPSPFAQEMTLRPLVLHPPAGAIELSFTARYTHEPSGYIFEQTWPLVRAGDELRLDDAAVPVMTQGAEVAWTLVAIMDDGATAELARGRYAGGPFVIDLSRGRRVAVEWVGPPPVDADLRWVRVRLRVRADSGELLDERTVELRGHQAPERQAVELEGAGRLEVSIERRYTDGSREREPYRALQGTTVFVTA